jgi:hypothetical protein
MVDGAGALENVRRGGPPGLYFWTINRGALHTKRVMLRPY